MANSVLCVLVRQNPGFYQNSFLRELESQWDMNNVVKCGGLNISPSWCQQECNLDLRGGGGGGGSRPLPSAHKDHFETQAANCKQSSSNQKKTWLLHPNLWKKSCWLQVFIAKDHKGTIITLQQRDSAPSESCKRCFLPLCSSLYRNTRASRHRCTKYI